MVGICCLPDLALLDEGLRNPGFAALAQDPRRRQARMLAAGIVMADRKESMEAPPSAIEGHTHAIVVLNEYRRDPRRDEPGAEWCTDAPAHRAWLRATETAVIIATQIRLLGWDDKARTETRSDVALNLVSVAAAVVVAEGGRLLNPYLGERVGVAGVTTTLDLAPDLPLAPLAEQTWWRTKGPASWLGARFATSALNRDRFARRDDADGPHPIESLTRVDSPTIFLDEPRVPKRSDMFARAQFGELGKGPKEAAARGQDVRKATPSSAQRRMLGAFALLQDGAPADGPRPADPARNAAAIQAASCFLGIEAVGLSRCPEWTWVSRDATGATITPPHDQTISMRVDQDYQTMEGASGDDWISVAQSVRASLRFSLLGGVSARQLRNLGYSTKPHTRMEGEVLQSPPLLRRRSSTKSAGSAR